MIEFNSTQPATPDTVSHYTSQVGLIGIIQNELVWVSSIRHLNDSAELAYAVNLMMDNLILPQNHIHFPAD